MFCPLHAWCVQPRPGTSQQTRVEKTSNKRWTGKDSIRLIDYKLNYTMEDARTGARSRDEAWELAREEGEYFFARFKEQT